VKSGLAERLRATFLAELDEQLRVMNEDLLALEADPTDAEHLRSLFRVAHTLKGAARAVDVPAIEEACHALETMLGKARSGQTVLSRPQFEILFAAADCLADAGQRMRAGEDPSPLCFQRLHGLLGAGQQNKPARNETRARSAAALGKQPARVTEPVTDANALAPARAQDYLRVESAKLDALLAAVEQLLIAVDGTSLRAGETNAVHELAANLADATRHLVRRARDTNGSEQNGHSDHERVAKLHENVRVLLDRSGRLTSLATADARDLSRVARGVAAATYGLRMRPFSEACEALPRVVRDLSATVGKSVALEVQGGDAYADRVVLDGLREAILHLVRNAVDHGIETPTGRRRAGKPEQGRITVAAALNGDRIVVTVQDDGAGLDLPKIRASLTRLGQPVPIDDRDLVAALFQGGVSTRAQATAISGRGVGLDLVRAAVERIRGSVDITSEPGKGTTCTLESPLTLMTVRALLAKVSSQIVAVPTAHVDRVVRVAPQDVRRAEGRDVLPAANGADERPIPVVSLARLLGPPLVEHSVGDRIHAIILRAQSRRLAVVVDELLDEQEIVVRPLEVGGVPLPHLSGVAVLSGGRVALVADAEQLLTAGVERDSVAAPLLRADAGGGARPNRRVLVVDDSITTRVLEQSILEAAGYTVLTAVDGADAWAFLQRDSCDVVVADVEMPRMDGFALCEAIRGSKRWERLPIVLVTALEKEEQRARGLELGADAYIGKSSFDQRTLLETIEQLLG
jgi:two-component system chemotaxis sensor kinase CheA